MAKSWLRIIGAIKRFVNRFGAIYPEPSTKLAGYAEDGPYHCKDCKYLKKGFVDENGKGRCNQPVMIADSEVKHDDKGLAIVNIQVGCCAFVDPPKKENEQSKEA